MKDSNSNNDSQSAEENLEDDKMLMELNRHLSIMAKRETLEIDDEEKRKAKVAARNKLGYPPRAHKKTYTIYRKAAGGWLLQ